MPEYRHPLASDHIPGVPPNYVHVGIREDNVPVADDGTFTAPEDVGAAIAERFGLDVSEIRAENAGGDPDCGDLDASTSADCGRPPGWGRNTDSGPCTDHVPEDT